MLIFGIIFLVLGIIVTYERTFLCSYDFFNRAFFFITYIVTYMFDNLEYKILIITAALIIGALLCFNIKFFSISPKGQYIVFNISLHELLNILEQAIKKQDIHYQIFDNSIFLDCQDAKTISVKPLIFNLNSIDSSNISDTDMHVIIEELYITLGQIKHKRISLLGSILFCFGVATIILFYRSIL